MASQYALSVPAGKFVPTNEASHVKFTRPDPGLRMENTAACSSCPEYHVKHGGVDPPGGSDRRHSVNVESPRIADMGITLMFLGVSPSSGMPGSASGKTDMSCGPAIDIGSSAAIIACSA